MRALLTVLQFLGVLAVMGGLYQLAGLSWTLIVGGLLVTGVGYLAERTLPDKPTTPSSGPTTEGDA
jgi:hypothetical protein